MAGLPMKADAALAPALQDAIRQFAADLGIPPQGITVLGGQPYINNIGLTLKVEADARRVKAVRSECQVDAWENEQKRAKFRCTIEFQDGASYEAFGYASPESVKMSTLRNPDYLNMTGETRAYNRAARKATGCGYVSAEELEQGEGAEPSAAPAEVATKASAPPVVAEPQPGVAPAQPPVLPKPMPAPPSGVPRGRDTVPVEKAHALSKAAEGLGYGPAELAAAIPQAIGKQVAVEALSVVQAFEVYKYLSAHPLKPAEEKTTPQQAPLDAGLVEL